MKRIITLLLLPLSLLAALTAFAGDGTGGGREMRLKESLQLTEEQAATVREILQEQRTKSAGVRANRELERADAKAQFDAIHADTRKRLAGVLSEEQLAKFDAHATARHEYGGERGAARLKEKLQLTDEQAGAVQTIMDEQRVKREAIRDSEGSREEKRARMETLGDETLARLGKVLTAEQMSQMERKRRHHDHESSRSKGGRGENRTAADGKDKATGDGEDQAPAGDN